MTEEERELVNLRIENAKIIEQLKASDKALVLAATAGRANLALGISILLALVVIYQAMKGH
jgi:hypothetical protein